VYRIPYTAALRILSMKTFRRLRSNLGCPRQNLRLLIRRCRLIAGGLLSTAVLGLSAHAYAQVPDTMAQRVLACTACHGKEGRAGNDGFYPRIAGKPPGYLYNQLLNFREGRRAYAPMIYLVEYLSDDYLREMADYFANQHPPFPPPQVGTYPASVLEQGRQLVQFGQPQKEVPACVSCHGQNLMGVAPAIPGLLGLPYDYLNAQFGAWRNATRRAASPDCMAAVAQRLSVAEINAALAWLSRQMPPADTRPASPSLQKLPMDCGSVSQGAGK
jgi:cytochrome c553